MMLAQQTFGSGWTQQRRRGVVAAKALTVNQRVVAIRSITLLHCKFEALGRHIICQRVNGIDPGDHAMLPNPQGCRQLIPGSSRQRVAHIALYRRDRPF